jgi:hypothetical protein
MRVSFTPQAETGIPGIVAQGHDLHSVGLFVKEQVVRESLKIRTTPATRVEVTGVRGRIPHHSRLPRISPSDRLRVNH